jgi:uncharacterized RDD family membrane protein YckC
VPPTAVPGYGYPPGGIRHPGTFAPGGAPLAEFWQRFVAYILDALILGAVLVIPTALLIGVLLVPSFMSLGLSASPDPVRILLLELLVIAIIAPLSLIASYVYSVRMCHRTGQTIGKRIMKIRVARRIDGGPIDLRMARRRWLVHQVAGGIAPYFSLADSLWLLWDQPYRQCLHDKCAETVVVQVAA